MYATFCVYRADTNLIAITADVHHISMFCMYANIYNVCICMYVCTNG